MDIIKIIAIAFGASILIYGLMTLTVIAYELRRKRKEKEEAERKSNELRQELLKTFFGGGNFSLDSNIGWQSLFSSKDTELTDISSVTATFTATDENDDDSDSTEW